MVGPLARRILGVTVFTLLAGVAEAGEGRSSFTVSATVIRSAAVRVTARPEGERVRVAAMVERVGGVAGLALAAAGEQGRVRVSGGALSSAIASNGGVVVLTVLPDGAPSAVRWRDSVE